MTRAIATGEEFASGAAPCARKIVTASRLHAAGAEGLWADASSLSASIMSASAKMFTEEGVGQAGVDGGSRLKVCAMAIKVLA